MRIIIVCLICFLNLFVKAQKLSIGGYLTPAYGNIIWGNGYSYPYYYRVASLGGGVVVNYYKGRWIFNGGLNYKNPKGGKDIPQFTSTGNSIGTRISSIEILTMPLGLSYSIVNVNKFKMFAGVNIENGLVFSENVDTGPYVIRRNGALFNKYYLGFTPRIGFEINITKRKFLMVNLGGSYQLPYQAKTIDGMLFLGSSRYCVNYVFIDFGYGFRIKN